MATTSPRPIRPCIPKQLDGDIPPQGGSREQDQGEREGEDGEARGDDDYEMTDPGDEDAQVIEDDADLFGDNDGGVNQQAAQGDEVR